MVRHEVECTQDTPQGAPLHCTPELAFSPTHPEQTVRLLIAHRTSLSVVVRENCPDEPHELSVEQRKEGGVWTFASAL